MPITLRLGVPRVSYSDLFDPDRLKELHKVFDSELAASNPELFAAWQSYRCDPGKARTPAEISALLVAVAGHVSCFVTQLFRIESETDALVARTTEQNPVFRFKIDFVRRRVLPTLKKISIPQDSASRTALETRIAALRGPGADLELATALAAVRLMDEEKKDRAAVAGPLEDLMQWCALHVHDSAYRHWVSFHFPETMDHFNLVQVQRPVSDLS